MFHIKNVCYGNIFYIIEQRIIIIFHNHFSITKWLNSRQNYHGMVWFIHSINTSFTVLGSYISWIYNYLCNQYLSLLTWIQIPLRWGVLDTTLYDKVCQWIAASQWFSPGTPVSSTNKTEITEILLKVTLNALTLTVLFVSRCNSLNRSKCTRSSTIWEILRSKWIIIM